MDELKQALDQVKAPRSQFEKLISSPIMLLIIPAIILGMMLIQSFSAVHPHDVKEEVLENRKELHFLKEKIQQLSSQVEIKTFDRIYRSEFENWLELFKKENKEIEIPKLNLNAPE